MLGLLSVSEGRAVTPEDQVVPLSAGERPLTVAVVAPVQDGPPRGSKMAGSGHCLSLSPTGRVSVLLFLLSSSIVPGGERRSRSCPR
jgi:hypothetical protein